MIRGAVAGVLLLTAAPAYAQDDGADCVSVVEQRLDGHGHAYWWGVLPDICVPRAGVSPHHIAAGTHYRVKSGGPVCVGTNDGRTISGHPYLQSGRNLDTDHGAGRYVAFIGGGYEVGIQPGTCQERGIRRCELGCGEWHLD